MDFLGLRNLTVIRDAVREIRKNHKNFDINAIPVDDKAVYEMLSKGDTAGVFQFESGGMTKWLMELSLSEWRI
jgi:DNA polymerase-3 subunit alpha